MRFFCEYCGNRIDAEIDDKCPSCGASYKKNKKFIELEEKRNKEKDLNNEYKHKIFNHTLSAIKFSKWFLLIPIVIFIVVLVIVIITFSNFGKIVDSQLNDSKTDNVEQIYDSIFGSDKEEKEVKVNFNEYGSTAEYRVKVTKYEVEEDVFNRAEEGYEYVKFHLIVENLSDSQIYKEDVNCIVDGIAQTNEFTSGYSDLPMFIQKDLTVKGTATFLVPKDATSYDIKYGDYVTIHIEK